MASGSTLTKRRSAYLWEDMVSGRKHMVNNQNGDHVLADRYGSHLPVCRIGISGVAGAKHMAVPKGEILNKTLVGPEPKRPGRLVDEVADERVSTMGRYRIRPVTESELWLVEVRIQRKLFPERFEAERVADLKFRKKVEEAHKNYKALEAQLGPRAGGLGGFEAKPTRQITQDDLRPYFNMRDEDAMPIMGNMDLFGLYRP